MISASIYAIYPIIAHHKRIILSRNTIERIFQSTDFNQAMAILNEHLAPFLKGDLIQADTPRRIEIYMAQQIEQFIRILSRFSFGSMASFRMIMNLYLDLGRVLKQVRSYYKNRAESIDKKSIPGIFHETLTILEKKHQELPIIFYESQLIQCYIDEALRLLEVIDADDRSFMLLQSWIDHHNLIIINNLSSVYKLSGEEIKTYLIHKGTPAIITHVRELMDGTCPDKLKHHQMATVFDIHQPQLNELKIKSIFYAEILRAIGGTPFRYSYCLAFFLLLQLESENIRLIFNGHYHRVETNILRDMVIAYPHHRE
ncbi:MAG: V-type ATPase subunit [Candidatus Delongbacteria bacterium]|nr:V-type ATPase subunit [Candidatus Delongbacteria bacterium]